MDRVGARCMALSEEVRELTSFTCVEEGEAAPLPFLRSFVAQNKPAVFRGAALHWPAMRKWTLPYLCERMGGKPLTVDFTPDGRGDAVVSTADGPCFVTPEERTMPMAAFVQQLRESRANPTLGVPYIQHQNGSFLEEFGELVDDAEEHLGWASEALGGRPEAVNMWVGDDRAVTSFHKDHYENLYVVVAGAKHFTLLPPADYHRLYTKHYPTGAYRQNQDTREFEVLRSGEPGDTVPWVSVDPHPPAEEAARAAAKFPRFFEGPAPLECTVQPGDVLYLPAMWYHHVRQGQNEEGVTIAVNFWYDMVFDMRYAYFNFLKATYDDTLAEEEQRASSSLD